MSVFSNYGRTLSGRHGPALKVLASVFLVVATSAAAQDTASVAATSADTTCPACVDFYAFANSPAVTQRLGGSLAELGRPTDARRLEQQITDIVTEAATAVRVGGARAGTDEYRLGAFYEACIDTARIRRLGGQVLQPAFRRVRTAATTREVMQLLGEFQRSYAIGFVTGAVAPDASDSRANTAVLIFASGLGLPNRDYYLRADDRFPTIRSRYEAYVRSMFKLTGDSDEAAAAHARTVLELETELARRQPTPAAIRDPRVLAYRPTFSELQSLTPHVPWRAFFDGLGAPALKTLNVRNTPEALRGLDSLLSRVPVDDWRTLLRWELLDTTAPFLSSDFAGQHAAMAQVLGAPAPFSSRSAQCATEARGFFGDIVGRRYVERHSSPAARERARAMVAQIQAVLREHLEHLDWMSDATKREALTKLDSMVHRVGYPDRWRSYAGLDMRRADYFGNRQRARRANMAASWARLTSRNERNAWTSSPTLASAVYNPQANAVVLTAAMLQPPTFDAAGDLAATYGAIGAVMGHEMTHAFDVLGGRFDASGNLRNWWSTEDAERYAARSRKLVEQYNAYPVDSTHRVNGETTLGENISDLGGLEVAYEAMERALAGTPRTVIGGFSPEQRFFLAHARLLRTLEGADAAINAANATHAPPRWRVNGPLSAMPSFAQAWACRAGTPMVRADSLRVRIW